MAVGLFNALQLQLTVHIHIQDRGIQTVNVVMECLEGMTSCWQTIDTDIQFYGTGCYIGMIGLIGYHTVAHQFGSVGHTLLPIIRHDGFTRIVRITREGNRDAVECFCSGFTLIDHPGQIARLQSLCFRTAAFVEIYFLSLNNGRQKNYKQQCRNFLHRKNSWG